MQEYITRKDFLRDAFKLFRREVRGGGRNTATPISEFILPPGVTAPDHYLKSCTQCYECVSVCPHQALQVWRDERSRFYGFPVIVPRRQPCYLCTDYPCITACPTEALQEQYVSHPLGTAVVDPGRCLAYNRSFCQSCITNCPLSGRAIAPDREGHPVVNAEVCTGCGICTAACPAEQPAILVQMNEKQGV